MGRLLIDPALPDGEALDNEIARLRSAMNGGSSGDGRMAESDCAFSKPSPPEKI
jgi:hypothetical protein